MYVEGMEDEDMKKETQNLAYPPAFKLGEHQPLSLCSVVKLQGPGLGRVGEKGSYQIIIEMK